MIHGFKSQLAGNDREGIARSSQSNSRQTKEGVKAPKENAKRAGCCGGNCQAEIQRRGTGDQIESALDATEVHAHQIGSNEAEQPDDAEEKARDN